MANSSTRTIVTCFLIYVDWKPVTLLIDKKNATELIRMAKDKGHDAFMKEMTIHDQRMKEIGLNIFTRLKDMTDANVNNILQVRNDLIRKSFELASETKIDTNIAWLKVRKPHGYPISELTYEEFNRWTLDIANFVLIQR